LHPISAFEVQFVSNHSRFAREAAATLLKLARTVSDPQTAAGFTDLAADLKDRIGERSIAPLEVDAIRKDAPPEK
jgi:hypothetical protein